MSVPTASALHLAAARALATRADRAPQRWAAAVAEHYRSARPEAPMAEVLPALERAAATAREVGGHDQARRWLEEAVRLRSSSDTVDPPTAALWLRLGGACADAGDFGAARRAYLAAAAGAGDDPAVLAEAALGYAGPWQSVEEVDPVFERLAETAAAGLPAGASPSRARLLGRLALARATAGDRAAHHLAADAVDEARRSGDPEAVICALHAVQMSGAVVLDRFERLALADEMVRLGVRSGLDPLTQLGRAHRVTALLEDGRVGEAATCVRSYDRELRRRGSVMEGWWSSLIRSTLALAVGDIAGAEAAAAAAVEIGTTLHPADAMAVYGAQVFAMRMAQGRLPELLSTLEAANGRHPDTPGWRAAYALACAESGDEVTAGRHLAGLLAHEDALADRYRTSTLCLLARIAARLDEPAACRRLHDLLTPLSGAFVVIGTGYAVTGPVDGYLGPLARRLGDPDRADRLLRRALAAALGVGNLLWTADIEAELASLHSLI